MALTAQLLGIGGARPTHQRWTHVCCIRVTVSSAIIDSRAARLGESMLVDRFHTLDGPDLGPRRTVVR